MVNILQISAFVNVQLSSTCNPSSFMLQASAANSNSANTANGDHGHIVTPHQSPSLRRTTGSTGSADSSGSVKQSSSGPRTLMFFKDCPRPLGCTVLLYGADADQLQLLKRVTKVCMLCSNKLLRLTCDIEKVLEVSNLCMDCPGFCLHDC